MRGVGFISWALPLPALAASVGKRRTTRELFSPPLASANKWDIHDKGAPGCFFGGGPGALYRWPRTNLHAERAEAGEEDARRDRRSHALFGPGIPASGGRSALQQSAAAAKTEVNSLTSPPQRAEMQASFACRLRFAYLSLFPPPAPHRTVPGFNVDEPSSPVAAKAYCSAR